MSVLDFAQDRCPEVAGMGEGGEGKIVIPRFKGITPTIILDVMVAYLRMGCCTTTPFDTCSNRTV